MPRSAPVSGLRWLIVARTLAASVVVHALSAPSLAQICAFVTNEADGTVSVIDAGTKTTTNTIPVGGSPTGLAITADGSTTYVDNTVPDGVAVISTAEESLTKTISLAGCSAALCGPEAVAIAASGHRAYVTSPIDDGSHILSVIDTATNSITNTVLIRPAAVARGGGVALTADGRFACVSGYLLKSVAGHTEAVLYSDVFDTTANTFVRRDRNLGRIDTLEDFLNSARTAAAVTPAGVCYVTDGFAGNVFVIALPANSLVTEIPLRTLAGSAVIPTGVAITSDGHFAYVSGGTSSPPPASMDEGQIFVIDTTTNKVTDAIQLNRGHFLNGVALSPDGTFAMTTDRDSNGVFVIDATTRPLRVTASIPVGAGAKSIAIASLPNGCPTVVQCVGDCGQDGFVTVDELLTMVNIALGNAPISECQAGDVSGEGEISIDEILTAVNNTLNGCPHPS